jgi:hypothetical protein
VGVIQLIGILVRALLASRAALTMENLALTPQFKFRTFWCRARGLRGIKKDGLSQVLSVLEG